ncbi:MAG: site-specific integrase [Prevotellaceae bacterium]|jgi:site-specific recombinase XerD|nr:site-specific integrase [Prevotellaceae bacterium]
MTSVKIKFRKSTIKNREGALYIQLIHNRKAKLVTTRFRLYPSEWDTRSSTVITDNTDNERNMYLQNIKNGSEIEIRQIYDLIALLERRGDYTTQELIEYYISNSFNGYFFPFVKYQIKKLKSENRTKTASIHETAGRSFSRFRYGEDIRIEKIDGSLMQRYEAYLKDNNLCINSISCYMRALRAIYNQAVEKGLTVSRNPFKDVYTGIDKTSKRAVTADVIVKLCRLDLSDSSLQLARDLFMFSFYTRGMSFVDMANLKQSNLKNGYLAYTRSKTKQGLSIKVEKCIEDIIERYKDLVIDDYILPIYSTQNRDYNSHLRTYNKRLKRLSEILSIEKPLSSYVSRHSWATIALRKGISTQVISEGMGHENEKTTRIYLASLDQSVIDNANAQIIAL